MAAQATPICIVSLRLATLLIYVLANQIKEARAERDRLSA